MKIVLTAIFINITTFSIGYCTAPEIIDYNQATAKERSANHLTQVVKAKLTKDKLDTSKALGKSEIVIGEKDIKQLLHMTRNDFGYDPWRKAKVIEVLDKTPLVTLVALYKKQGANLEYQYLVMDVIFRNDPLVALDHIVASENNYARKYMLSRYLATYAELSIIEAVHWLSMQDLTVFDAHEIGDNGMSVVASMFTRLATIDNELAILYLNNLHIKLRAAATKGIAKSITSSAQFQALVERLSKNQHPYVVSKLTTQWASKFPKEASIWYKSKAGISNKIAHTIFETWCEDDFEKAADWYINTQTVDGPLSKAKSPNAYDSNTPLARVSNIVSNGFRSDIGRERIKAWLDLQQDEVRDEGYYFMLRFSIHKDTNYAITHLALIKKTDDRYYLSRQIGKQLSLNDKEASNDFVNNSEFASQLQTESWY